MLQVLNVRKARPSRAETKAKNLPERPETAWNGGFAGARAHFRAWNEGEKSLSFCKAA